MSPDESHKKILTDHVYDNQRRSGKPADYILSFISQIYIYRYIQVNYVRTCIINMSAVFAVFRFACVCSSRSLRRCSAVQKAAGVVVVFGLALSQFLASTIVL